MHRVCIPFGRLKSVYVLLRRCLVRHSLEDETRSSKILAGLGVIGEQSLFF